MFDQFDQLNLIMQAWVIVGFASFVCWAVFAAFVFACWVLSFWKQVSGDE